VQVAKAIGSSFNLVTLAPKTVREMTQLPRETQKGTKTNQKAQMDTNQKPRLNTQKHTRPNRAV